MKKILVYLYNNMAYWEISILMQLFSYDFKEKVKIISFSDKEETLISSSNIKYKADLTIDDIVDYNDIDGLVIPGGFIGNINPLLCELIRKLNNKNRIIGAICGAPAILAYSKILEDKKFTTSHTEEYYITNKLINPFDFSNYVGNGVVIDKNIITAKPNYFIEFAVEYCSMLDLFESEKNKLGTLNWFKIK